MACRAAILISDCIFHQSEYVVPLPRVLLFAFGVVFRFEWAIIVILDLTEHQISQLFQTCQLFLRVLLFHFDSIFIKQPNVQILDEVLVLEEDLVLVTLAHNQETFANQLKQFVVLYPLHFWSDEDVIDFLKEEVGGHAVERHRDSTQHYKIKQQGHVKLIFSVAGLCLNSQQSIQNDRHIGDD